MRILYLHQHFTTPDGRSGTRSYELAGRLARRGHQVTVVCGCNIMTKSGLTGKFRRGVRQGMVNNFKVVEFKIGYSNYLPLFFRSLTFMDFALRSTVWAFFRKYDLVFATSTPLTVAIPAILLRFFRGIPYVFEARDLWPELPRAMGLIKNRLVLLLLESLETCSYRQAIGCIGLAPGIVEGIVKKRLTAEKVIMVPNGCDLDIFRNERKSRAKSGLGDGKFIALFAGAHGKANGLLSVLHAAQDVLSRGCDRIHFLFVGDGKDKPLLVEYCRANTISNCTFMEPKSKTDIAVLMNMVDAGLQILSNVPSFYNGTSPNKFFDYIASGLPVVINYPGWLASLVSEYECGVAVPPDDPGAFASALIEMSQNPAGCRKMSENARGLAESRFSRDALGKQFCDFIESLR